MPHGAPDWSKYRPESTTYPVLDLAELAARTAIPISYDRRGDTMFTDCFDFTMNKWFITSDGVGGTVVVDPVYAVAGGHSAKLTPPGIAPNWVLMTHGEPLPQGDTVGFETRWGVWNEFGSIYWEIFIHDGVDVYDYRIRYWIDGGGNHIYQYYDHLAAWVTFLTGYEPAGQPAAFNVAKLVINWKTRHYLRFLANDLWGTPVGARARLFGGTTARYMLYRVRYYGANTGDEPGYIDSVIVTCDEI